MPPADNRPALDQFIGENLRELRGKRSQADVADLMTAHGVPWSKTTVLNIEAGNRALRLSEASLLARVLGTSVDELVGDNPLPAGVRAQTHELERRWFDAVDTAERLYRAQLSFARLLDREVQQGSISSEQATKAFERSALVTPAELSFLSMKIALQSLKKRERESPDAHFSAELLRRYQTDFEILEATDLAHRDDL